MEVATLFALGLGLLFSGVSVTIALSDVLEGKLATAPDHSGEMANLQADLRGAFA